MESNLGKNSMEKFRAMSLKEDIRLLIGERENRGRGGMERDLFGARPESDSVLT